METVDLGKHRPAPTQVYSLHHPNLQAVRPVSTKSTAWAGLCPSKSTACTTQIYRLSGLYPPNLQLGQVCAHPSLQSAPPKSTGCQACTHQIYSLGRSVPIQVYSLHHPNLQAVRPAPTISTAWVGLCPSKSTVCTTQIYRLSGLHPPYLQLG